MNQNDHNNQSTIGFDAQKKSVITVDVISASDLPAVDHHGILFLLFIYIIKSFLILNIIIFFNNLK